MEILKDVIDCFIVIFSLFFFRIFNKNKISRVIKLDYLLLKLELGLDIILYFCLILF